MPEILNRRKKGYGERHENKILREFFAVYKPPGNQKVYQYKGSKFDCRYSKGETLTGKPGNDYSENRYSQKGGDPPAIPAKCKFSGEQIHGQQYQNNGQKQQFIIIRTTGYLRRQIETIIINKNEEAQEQFEISFVYYPTDRQKHQGNAYQYYLIHLHPNSIFYKP
jgi:hypothetical protein